MYPLFLSKLSFFDDALKETTQKFIFIGIIRGHMINSKSKTKLSRPRYDLL